MRVLVANTGSSSVKLRLVDAHERVVSSQDLPASADSLDEGAIRRFAAGAGAGAGGIDAVGHRVVHGGAAFRRATVVDAESIEGLEQLGDLAPLHNGPSLRLLAALRRACPDVPHVACFDTGFHATLPDAAALYALPRAWIDRYGLRRYGFHGLSHAWAARRAPELLDRPASDLRLVSCHLGAGASLAAIAGGRSVDTTMGFTPNEGLVMATRSGSVDPGLVLWLLRDAGLTADVVEHTLEHESGLRGLSGHSGDMRELLAATAAGDERAATAIDVYLHRLRAGIAAMAAALGGIDALVFTGGVGEHAAAIRARACERLDFLGIALDPRRNEREHEADAPLSPPHAPAAVLLIHSREELEIARLVRELLGS